MNYKFIYCTNLLFECIYSSLNCRISMSNQYIDAHIIVLSIIKQLHEYLLAAPEGFHSRFVTVVYKSPVLTK